MRWFGRSNVGDQGSSYKTSGGVCVCVCPVVCHKNSVGSACQAFPGPKIREGSVGSMSTAQTRHSALRSQSPHCTWPSAHTKAV